MGFRRSYGRRSGSAARAAFSTAVSSDALSCPRPRQVVHTLARAVRELGVPHPLHIHGSNLGVAGNIESTLETIAALEGTLDFFIQAAFGFPSLGEVYKYAAYDGLQRLQRRHGEFRRSKEDDSQ